MIRAFRKHTEKIEAQAAEIEREVEAKRRELEVARLNDAVDLYLKAQEIKNPQDREMVLSVVQHLLQQPVQKKRTSGPTGPR